MFFLADDPQAASKIPEFLTTFYDTQKTVTPKYEFTQGTESPIQGRSGGLIPEATEGISDIDNDEEDLIETEETNDV